MPIIRTVKVFNEHKIKEKNSVFIGQVYPISSEEEATNILSDIRRKFYDATHHCFCYKLEDGKFRYSDDGEPSGTAGIRILNTIEHHNLLGILVIVIRYFGGVKLGVGPLGKAYHECAEGVISSSLMIEKKSYTHTSFTVDFNNMSHVFRILSAHDVKNIETTYGEDVKVKCFINSEVIEEIISKLIELTNGSIQITTDNTPQFL